MTKLKRLIPFLITMVLVLVVSTWNAYGYTVNNDLSAYGYVVEEYGSYTLAGGDAVRVSYSPWGALNYQTVHIAQEQFNVSNSSEVPDGQGNWGVMLADMAGADANNGYLWIAAPSELGGTSSNVQSVVTRLGGNYSYVISYLQSNQQAISTTDLYNGNLYTYVPFATIVSQSGAKFGPQVVKATGQTYQGHPVYQYTYPVYTSNPPQATGLSVMDTTTGQTGVVTQGDQIQFAASSSVPLWSGLAAYHYDTVQITDNTTGQSQWVVTGSYNIKGYNMTPVSGGHGFYTDTLSPNSSTFSTSSLVVGHTYTAKFWVSDGVHRLSSTPATTTFSVVAGTHPTVNLTANPTSLTTGQSTVLTATASNVPSDDYIQIVDQSNDNTLNGSNTWADDLLGETSLTTNASDNQSQTVTYNAELVNAITGQVDATSSNVQVTWGSPPPPPILSPASISFSANPTNLSSGNATNLSYTVTNMASGDTVNIVGTGGANAWNQSGLTQSFGNHAEIEYPVNGASTIVQYTATLYGSSGQVLSQAYASVTWTSPTPQIHFSASPTLLNAGSTSFLSYGVSNMVSGDTVNIIGTGGQDAWNQSGLTTPTGNYSEVENPVNGGSVTVHYTAYLYSQSGQVLSTATAAVTWVSVAPTITMNAVPAQLVPGQPSTISYAAQGLAPGDYINVVGTGGAHMWSTSNQTNPNEQYNEVENPSGGQTITVHYTATIYSSSGQAITNASTAAVWSNAWNGIISLSANPTRLAINNSTTLNATTSQAIPSGYTLEIMDQTTGQLVSSSSSSPEQTQYNSGRAETDTFVAIVSDGYEQVGASSNTVQVQWSSASVSANPMSLSINHASTVTATAGNMPSSYWLILFNQTTGQILGATQSSTLSVQQNESTAQTDNYVAYISSTSSVNNAYITSNSISVDWYSVTLTANPTSLPVSNTSTLTATAQNIPSGYYLMIVDQTINKVIAQGAAGQTTLTVTQDKSTPETDTYVAEVAIPPNSGGTSVAYSGTNYGWISNLTHSLVEAHWNGTTYLIDFWPYAPSGSTLYWSYSSDGGKTWALASQTLSTYWAETYNMQGAEWDSQLGVVVGYVGTTNSMGEVGFVMTGPTSLNFTATGNDPTNANNGAMALDSAGGGFLAVEHGSSGSIYNANMQSYHYMQYNGSSITNDSDAEFGISRSAGGEYAGGVVSTGPHLFTDIFSLSTGQIWAANLKWTPATSTSAANLTYTSIQHYQAGATQFAIGTRWISSLGVVKFYYTSMGTNPTLYSNTYNPSTGTFGTPVAETTLSGLIQTNVNVAFYMPNDTTVALMYSSEQSGAPVYLTTNLSGTWSTKLVTQPPSGEYTYGVASQFNGDTTMAHFAYVIYNGAKNYTIYDYQLPLVSTTSLPTTIAATSSPVSVQWYQWQLALSAIPTKLYEGQSTTLTATSSGAPSGSVIQIWDTTTNKMVAESVPNTTSLTGTWMEQTATIDTFTAYFVDPSTGSQLQNSNNVQVQWIQIPLTLTNAEIYHTPHWLDNLTAWNAQNPTQARPLSDFWAGEQLNFKVLPSINTISQATVTILGLNYSSYAPFGAPVNVTIDLTYDPTTGYLLGNTDPTWAPWFQYLLDGTYTVSFYVKSTDNQVATATATFEINGNWTDYWKNTQIY